MTQLQQQYYRQQLMRQQQLYAYARYMQQMQAAGDEQKDPVTPTKTITVNAGQGGSVAGGGTYNVGQTAVISAHADTGYFFDKWDDEVQDNPRNVQITETMTKTDFTAYFQAGVAKPFVVDGVAYESLNLALANCAPGANIQMTCDYDCAEVQVFDKNVTLDCKGHAINAAIPDTQNEPLFAVTAGPVTVKNAELKGYAKYLMTVEAGIETLTFENVVSDIDITKNAVQIRGPVVIKDCDLKIDVQFASQSGWSDAFRVYKDGTLVIDNSTIDGTESVTKPEGMVGLVNDALIVGQGGLITVRNNSVLKSKYAAIGCGYENGKTAYSTAVVSDSKIIGGNGWGDENSKRVALTTLNTNENVYTITNTEITGAVIAQGKMSARQYIVNGGKFDGYEFVLDQTSKDSYKLGYGTDGYTPAGIAESQNQPGSFYPTSTNAMVITAGRFAAKPLATYIASGSTLKADTEPGWWVVAPIQKVTITAKPDDPSHGSVTGGGDYLPGTDAQLEATPATGYMFQTWNDGVLTAARTVHVEESMTQTEFIATFVQVKTFTVNGNGYDTLPEAYAAANAGDTITQNANYTESTQLVIEKAVKLDMNGNSISFQYDSTITPFDNNSALSVLNGVIDTRGATVGNLVKSSNSGSNTLVFDNVFVYDNTQGKTFDVYGDFTMNECSVITTATKAYAVINNNGTSTVHVKDSVIDRSGNTSYNSATSQYHTAACNAGTGNIYIEGDNTRIITRNCALGQLGSVIGNIYVTGGVISSDQRLFTPRTGKLTISGNPELYGHLDANNKNSVPYTISGGKFHNVTPYKVSDTVASETTPMHQWTSSGDYWKVAAVTGGSFDVNIYTEYQHVTASSVHILGPESTHKMQQNTETGMWDVVPA